MKYITTLSNNIRLVVLSLALLSLFFNPYTVNASCEEPGTPEDELESQDAVFTGGVVYISSANALLMDSGSKILGLIGFDPADAYEAFSYSRRIVFEVDRSWKGVTTSSVTIRTGYNDGNSSSYPFEIGSYYLVYASHAYGDPNKYLLTSLCHRTMESPNNSEDIAYLNTQPILELKYFPAIIRIIDGNLAAATLLIIGFIYLLCRRNSVKAR